MISVLAPQSKDSDNISFDQFVQKYSKRYTSSEEVRFNSNYSLDEMLLKCSFSFFQYEKRKAIFEENMVKAKRQNRDGTSDAVFGVTSLSDMTDEEFFKFKNSLKRNDWESSFWDSKKIFSHSGSRLPERIDWREKVQLFNLLRMRVDIKDQGPPLRYLIWYCENLGRPTRLNDTVVLFIILGVRFQC